MCTRGSVVASCWAQSPWHPNWMGSVLSFSPAVRFDHKNPLINGAIWLGRFCSWVQHECLFWRLMNEQKLKCLLDRPLHHVFMLLQCFWAPLPVLRPTEDMSRLLTFPQLLFVNGCGICAQSHSMRLHACASVNACMHSVRTLCHRVHFQAIL